MRVLTANPGSSSLKLALVEHGTAVAESVVDRWDGTTLDELDDFGRRHGPVDAVAVRVVHGGDRAGAAYLTEAVLAELTALVPLAPLHQPRCLAVARHAARMFSRTPVVGGFDTAFHVELPPHAATYALPAAWRAEFGIRRSGYHGLSAAYACRAAARLLDAPVERLGLLCCHLGAGVSVTAVAHGRSVDTSMGFTPLDGVPMATRPGAIDPAIPLHLMRQGLTLDAVDDALNRRSGLAGLTGTGGDLRDVLRARLLGDPDAELAIEVYLHRLRREIAAAAVSLERLDAVVLTGGVAEHHAWLREELFAPPQLGIVLDPDRNAAAGDRAISAEGARVPVLVVTCREDLELARDTERLLAGQRAGAIP